MLTGLRASIGVTCFSSSHRSWLNGESHCLVSQNHLCKLFSSLRKWVWLARQSLPIMRSCLTIIAAHDQDEFLSFIPCITLPPYYIFGYYITTSIPDTHHLHLLSSPSAAGRRPSCLRRLHVESLMYFLVPRMCLLVEWNQWMRVTLPQTNQCS